LEAGPPLAFRTADGDNGCHGGKRGTDRP